jgi:transcription antitermination factor NusG
MVEGHINKPGTPRSAVTTLIKSPSAAAEAFSRRRLGDLEAKDLGSTGSQSSYAKAIPWLVVKTKTKCEKFVRDKIQAMGMDAFVPLKKRTAKYNRKVKVYELPLITCYTFVRLDKERRNEVLALPYVQGMLRMDGRDCTVSDREIQWLHMVSGTDLDIKTEILSMVTGDQVMLAYGQLAGMEGTIVAHRSKHEVVVALESIGMQMVLQVDPAMLVKL